jgi:cytochrome c553
MDSLVILLIVLVVSRDDSESLVSRLTDSIVERAGSQPKQAPTKKLRKTKAQKMAAIAAYYQTYPCTTSKVAGKALGIHDSDVRRLSKQIRHTGEE